ncbi:hypothetical protein FW774_04830 (plasmid) [Pedobacter sp. BS3]|uniref:LamG-like jellyroll fold domain-containing protein n=1 Tax=Pedobacter sp. BS3 TaxID=2567937 RepID=UPI0011EE7657|nr:LamG-like jellyroll fold domain-containing protein [Pedobacter sp. BS3]TZF86373.1 hypothetical protein FW774_04830 [Pedobacter sp. BS3]
MNKILYIIGAIIVILSMPGKLVLAQSADPRNIQNGYSIYDNGYIDQPYVVVLKDGRWLCVFTTGAESESRPGQHIVSAISVDHGKTWSDVVAIEPNVGPISSWAIPYLTSYGRVYVFYNYNGDNVSKVNGKPIRQAGLLGWYCYKFSDDNGKTWSQRYRLPVRKTSLDFNNDFKGKVQMFWGIDKPDKIKSSIYFAFTKLGKFPQDIGEGWLFKSDNIAFEKDPGKIHWQMLPEGDAGLRNPAFGSVQEEHNTVTLSNGNIYCMYRTAMGFPADAYSQDAGKTWTLPQRAVYSLGNTIKTPRACPRVFKCANGKYLFWFHNHGGKDFKGRNPAWISGGIEKNGKIYWSQPEIILYSNDLTYAGMSYPDLIEQDGKYWITETQKTKARVHAVDVDLLKGLWNQPTARKLIRKGLIYNQAGIKANSTVAAGTLPNLQEGGFTIDLWLELKDMEPGQIVLDNRDNQGKGVRLITTPQHTLRLELSDGKHTEGWDTDPGTLAAGKLHHVVFIVDGLPDIITVVVDGKLCDGGTARIHGWGRFSDKMQNIGNNAIWKLAPALHGSLVNLRLYNRYLTTSEAISNFHAGIKRK